MQTFRHLALILVLSGVTFFVNLGGPKLWDRDEPRNARCAVEMLERNDWTVPTFNAELRTHKPILLYWLMMTSYQAFGVSEFSARFWSAFLGVATAVVTYWIGRNVSDSRTALMSSLILVTTLMFSVSSRAATPDSTLIFFCTLAFAIFIDGVNRSADSIPSTLHWLGVYAAMAAAVLAKGPVGFVLPCTVIGSHLMFIAAKNATPNPEGNKWRHAIFGIANWIAQFFPALKRMRPLLALITMAAIALPWYVIVGIQTNGEWLEGFLWKHNLERATSAMEGHNGSFLFYYPVAILIGFFPWSVFAVPAAMVTWRCIRNDNFNPNVVFLLCWIATFVGVFSIAQTKLPSYVTPTYPAIAILVALLFGGEKASSDRTIYAWMTIALTVLAIVGAGICIGGWIAFGRFLPNEKWICLVGIFPLMAGSIGILTMRKFDGLTMQRVVQGFSFAFILAIFGWCAGLVSQHQEFDQLFSKHPITPQTSRLASFASQEPSWVFYWGKPITHFRRMETAGVIDFLREDNENYLLTTNNGLKMLEEQTAGQLVVVSEADYFLKNSKILLVSCNPRIARRSRDFNSNGNATQ